MKIGGEYGGFSRWIARIHFLESLEKLRPDIIGELDSLIDKAEQTFKELMLKIEKEIEEINTEYDNAERDIERYEKEVPYPEGNPNEPKYRSKKMTDEEWINYQERYERDHGKKPDLKYITREMVDDWNRELDGTTKEQRKWLSNRADMFSGITSALNKKIVVSDYFAAVSKIEGFYNYLQETDIKIAVHNWASKYSLNSWVAEAGLYEIAWWSILKDVVDEDSKIMLSTIYATIDKDESNLEIIKDDKIDGLEKYFKRRIPKMSYVTPFIYNPITHRKSGYRDFIMKMFSAKLDKYIDDIEAETMEAQISKTPDTRNMERFEWLVRYQVCGESYNQIAKSVYTSREAVTARIKETAEMCDITLRSPGKPGRPKKK